MALMLWIRSNWLAAPSKTCASAGTGDRQLVAPCPQPQRPKFQLFKMLQGSLGLPALLWLLTTWPAQAALELRVAIERNVSSIRVGSSTAAVVRDQSGQAFSLSGGQGAQVQLQAGKVWVQGKPVDGMVWVEPQDGGLVWIDDRWYRGRALLVPTGQGLTAVNYVDLEEYLYSVIGSEMPASWPIEALKAQAVAARSYALYQRQTGANSLYDIGDTQAWQVYKGVESEYTSTQQAVMATEGQVLIYQGKIIEAVFHSSSGGHTENVEDVWVEPLPYLRGVPDFDQGTPVYQWSKTFSIADLSNRLGVGQVRALVPEKFTPRGRVARIRVETSNGSRVMSGNDFREALGLRSTLFRVSLGGNAADKQGGGPSFVFTGRGFGHGLGMSQWGAHNLAQRGWNYQQIVLYYYRGADLAQIQVQ